LTLSLRNLGFTTTQSNLLSIPSSVIGLSMLLFTAYLSEIVNSRVIATIVLQIWALPLLVALYTFNETTSQWVYFAVVTLVTGFPYVHPIQVAWTSRNSYSVRTRTISASAYNMFVQAGAIIYVQLLPLSSLRYTHALHPIRQIFIERTIRQVAPAFTSCHVTIFTSYSRQPLCKPCAILH
jgi:hypothetical protein